MSAVKRRIQPFRRVTRLHTSDESRHTFCPLCGAQGIDSMFIPSTYAFYRHLVGNEYVYNHSMPWRTHHWQQNTMDYRCHVPGGKIGHRLPRRLRACLEKWAAMTPEEARAARTERVLRASRRLAASQAPPIVHACARPTHRWRRSTASRPPRTQRWPPWARAPRRGNGCGGQL